MNANSLIKIEQLKKHYKGGAIKALDGLDLEITKGEVVVIIGPSGSGKSTFLRCLNRTFARIVKYTGPKSVTSALFLMLHKSAGFR